VEEKVRKTFFDAGYICFFSAKNTLVSLPTSFIATFFMSNGS